jgi:hypothetical protein
MVNKNPGTPQGNPRSRKLDYSIEMQEGDSLPTKHSIYGSKPLPDQKYSTRAIGSRNSNTNITHADSRKPGTLNQPNPRQTQQKKMGGTDGAKGKNL